MSPFELTLALNAAGDHICTQTPHPVLIYKGKGTVSTLTFVPSPSVCFCPQVWTVTMLWYSCCGRGLALVNNTCLSMALCLVLPDCKCSLVSP